MFFAKRSSEVLFRIARIVFFDTHAECSSLLHFFLAFPSLRLSCDIVRKALGCVRKPTLKQSQQTWHNFFLWYILIGTQRKNLVIDTEALGTLRSTLRASDAFRNGLSRRSKEYLLLSVFNDGSVGNSSLLFVNSHVSRSCVAPRTRRIVLKFIRKIEIWLFHPAPCRNANEGRRDAEYISRSKETTFKSEKRKKEEESMAEISMFRRCFALEDRFKFTVPKREESRDRIY